MHPPKVNLLEHDVPDRPAKRRRFSVVKGVLLGVAALVIILPIIFTFASARLLKAAAGLNPLKAKSEKVSLIEQVRRLVGNSERQLHGEDRDRVNILLTGEGGDGHDGPHLTDTILFVSIQPSTGKIGMVSIPRDLWIDIPNYGLSRINNANAIAENKQPGSGGAYASQVIGSVVLNQPIDYYIRVDFSAFKTLVDDVGGVTVSVDHAFTDYSYPTDNSLYQTVRFDAGWQTMNGDRALQFVRSRHGTNGEASDFARSKRQQKVLVALKEKIISFDTLLNPSRIASILETLQTHVITDMELWEVAKIAKYAKGLKTDSINHYVLDDNPEGPLYATSIPVSNGDAYALLPRRGDWTDVQRIARDILDDAKQPAAAAEKVRALRVQVLNGTARVGLAQTAAAQLAKLGYDVVRVGNNTDRNVAETTIYDLTNGTQASALSTLQNLLNAQVSLTVPGYLSSGLTPSGVTVTSGAGAAPNADFLVVIGKNSP